MRTLFAFFTLIYLLALTGCSKSNDDSSPSLITPKNIIQVKIDTSFLTDQSENWIIAHDINGKLLAYDSFESGDLVILESDNDIPDNRVNITFFQYFVDSRKQHYLESYLSNVIGQEWTLKKEPFTPQNHGNKTGNFTVSVSGVPEGSAFQLSNRNAMTTAYTWGPGILNFSGELYESDPSWFLYVADHTGIPKYKFYNNVVNNSSFIESYSALNNFDKTVTVAFPATKTSDIYYFVHSYEPGQSLDYSSYLTNVNFSNSYFARPNELRSSITLGFLDMLPINRIVLDIRTSTYKYVYARSGTAPEQITLPLNAEFELRDKSVTNFQYQSSQDFIYRISYWYDTTSTAILSWFVRAPQAGVQKISELPAEFATRYPEFNSSNLSHVETAFITQGNTYNDLIDEKFKGKSKPVAYESYSVTPK